jgi:myo-inositol 2-dehydrogenase/D-chiro-inositol 1-dehydrogenase
MSIGIGVVGAGVMGADHALTLARAVGGAHVAAICDADAARAAQVARETRARRTHADGMAVIADPGVGAVLIASPDATHAELVLACLKAGKPVLCEKPLSPAIPECLEIMQAEMALGRRLVQVGFMRRFDPGYAGLHAGLAAGRLGAALMLHCIHRNASMPGFFTAGMLITNAAVHEFDIARWLLGDEITAATVFRPGGAAGDRLDRLFLVLETARGVLVDVEVFMAAGYGYDVRAELVCERGTLARRPVDPVRVCHEGAESLAIAADWRGHFAAAYQRQLQAWVQSLHTGQPTGGATAWDGYAATAVAAACVEALETGRRTEVRLQAKPALYG